MLKLTHFVIYFKCSPVPQTVINKITTIVTVNKGITETNMLLGHIRDGGDLDTNCDIIMIYWW